MLTVSFFTRTPETSMRIEKVQFIRPTLTVLGIYSVIYLLICGMRHQRYSFQTGENSEILETNDTYANQEMNKKWYMHT